MRSRSPVRPSGSNLGAAEVPVGSPTWAACVALTRRAVRLLRPRLLVAVGGEAVGFFGHVGAEPRWQDGSVAAADRAGASIVPMSLAGRSVVAVALVHEPPTPEPGSADHPHRP